jgi:hypothetical protein
VPGLVGQSNVGSLGWALSRTYPIDQFPSANDPNHPGVISSNAVNAAAPTIGIVGGTLMNNIILGGGVLSLTWVVFISSLSTGTNRYIVRFGSGDTIGSGISNGIFFEYSDNSNAGNWILRTANAGVFNSTNTAVAVTTGWHVLNILVNFNATSILFTIDGVAQGPVAVNIPTAAPITPYWNLNWVSGTIATGTIQLDLMSMQLTLTNARF